MTGLSVRAMIGTYSALALALFAYLYLPLLASRQQLDPSAVAELVNESLLSLNKGLHADNRHVVAIVTGSTNGIGRELAGQLYGLGLTVIVASRNADKCDRVIKELTAEHPESKGDLRKGVIDTGDLESVAAFSREFIASKSPLHMLVLNAGIHYASTELAGGRSAMDPAVPALSPQSYDLAFSTNYLGHFLLAKLLVPALQASGPGTRLLHVSSSYHFQSDGTMLVAASGATPLAARGDVNTAQHRGQSYANNKLAQVLHAKELQRRLDQTSSSSNSLIATSFCPGWVDTGIIPNNPGGNALRLLAFNAKAATIGLLGGLLSRRVRGGEFVSIFRNLVTTQAWCADVLALVTRLGVREATVHALAAFILFTEGASYGFTVAPSSPESHDERLARDLFDWSDRAVAPFAASASASASASG